MHRGFDILFPVWEKILNISEGQLAQQINKRVPKFEMRLVAPSQWRVGLIPRVCDSEVRGERQSNPFPKFESPV